MLPTPFMGLVLPTVGVTFGPTWASDLNDALSQVDAHNHTVGNGVPIPSSGISLDADLPFSSFNATLLRSVRFVNQGSPLALPSDLGCLYESSGNLYYNNSVGNQVRITAGAGLDASSVGGFGGDYGTSTASAFYTSFTSTFTFWQNANVSAFMDVGATTIHPSNSSTLGVTLKASTSLGGSYNLTFPISLPASTKFLTVDASGAIGDVVDVDNSTIIISSNTIQLGTIPNNTITTGMIIDGDVTFPKLSAPNYALSSSSGTFSTGSPGFVSVVSVPITVQAGRPVHVELQWAFNAGPTPALLEITGAAEILITRDVVTANAYYTTIPTPARLPISSVAFTDFTVVGQPPGTTITYTLFVRASAGVITVNNGVLAVKECL